MAPQRRSAAMVISAFAQPESHWYARIVFYEDPLLPAVEARPQTSIDGVCEVVRTWLTSVTGDHASVDNHKAAAT